MHRDCLAFEILAWPFAVDCPALGVDAAIGANVCFQVCWLGQESEWIVHIWPITKIPSLAHTPHYPEEQRHVFSSYLCHYMRADISRSRNHLTDRRDMVLGDKPDAHPLSIFDEEVRRSDRPSKQEDAARRNEYVERVLV
ncbi:hypothetical protein SISSUDRAFT_1067430 [Sistotremastrum suecicum HHB10207 ss-3]|uniref:Uncharacterized protein n=1 Tax=Sistotremastrum suecicum HHB10207 ss-3 TaxID=1314776 RepID=A0A165X4V4_9AGAM|nr:hypothetical protein SISSUDRAFT_1067430 [Sistotremastrum suecicum HHB10207 ss-3]